MSSNWSPKDPADIADYWFDWTDFLPTDEAITNATVTVPAGLTQIGDEDYTGNIVRVRLSGGTDGTSYNVDCLIQTDAGQTFEITKGLKVKERVKA